MAVLVGLDLVDVSTVAEALQAHGDRYLSRIYTRGERDECGLDTKQLAARFAVKEATMKVLDSQPLPWDAIEVTARPGPELRVVLRGAARAAAARRGVGRLSVSAATTAARATAIVIGDTTP